MKILFKISLVLFMGAVMFAACSDDDLEDIPEQNEVVLETFIVSNNTVTIKCSYHPNKSVAYQLQIGNTVSEKYSKNRFLKILNLSPGNKYTIKATIFDTDQKAIGMSKFDFKTTNTPLPDDMVIPSRSIEIVEENL